MRYLFMHLDEIGGAIGKDHLMLFLDYDGTLAPIAHTPDKAVIPWKTMQVLRGLMARPDCAVAVISGRALSDVKKRVGLENIIYSGNHGLEIEGPKLRFFNPLSRRYRIILEQIKIDLLGKISAIEGALLEDKELSLSLHYRKVHRNNVPQLEAIFNDTVAPYLMRGSIDIGSGKMVFEIRPPLAWDKGKAVLWLLMRQRFVFKGKKIFPIYIGDDVTDEDAFKVLGNEGAGIFVGNPRASYAQYYLRDTDDVARFLRFILDKREGKTDA